MLKHDLKGLTVPEFQKLRSQKLIAIFSFRFDAKLVPALKQNLWSVVDGFVSWDDRAAKEVFSSEGERRQKLIEEARKLGADWVLGVDPDERLEKDAARKIRGCMRKKRHSIWSFQVCDLYEIDKYRSDGIWKQKQVQRLFPVSDTMVFEYDALHSQFPPIYPVLKVRSSDVILYHLKMLDPKRRAARRDLYNKLDPGGEFQTIGYDYLADETGIELTQIDPNRGFVPPHEENGDLWMADLGENGTASSAKKKEGAIDQALSGIDDIDRAASLRKDPKNAEDLQLIADALSHQGKFAESADFLSSKAARMSFNSRIEQLRFQPPLGTTTQESCFQELGWTKGNVTIVWGRNAKPFAPMATIAMGVGAPSELKNAVASLLSQEEAASVIVVNSGGGDLQALLGEMYDRVIAVSVPERIFVGAARNIGVYLSNATWMSFLAGDCVARPGWIAERLKKHLEGFAAVSSPVVNSDPDSAVAWAYHLSLYVLRLPDTPEAFRIDYGLSLERKLIEKAGYYDASLRIMEDTALKGRIAALGKIGFAEGALTEHKAETRLIWALTEKVKRSRRAVRLVPTMASRSLEPGFGRPWFALRTAVKQAVLKKQKILRRVRRGLPVPQSEASFKRGAALHFLFGLAEAIGLLIEFPREVRDRTRAQNILSALKSGKTHKAKGLVARWGKDMRLGELASRELAAELALAGLTDEAVSILDRVSRRYADSSGVKRLKQSIANGLFQ